MGRFGVSPEKEAELERRMAACGLRESDLEESFIRGSGAGGQKINKTSSCVHLTHRPSGLDVRVQEARSQAMNRFFARRRLCELLEARSLGAESPAAMRQAKIRKQKKRRRRRHADPQESAHTLPATESNAGESLEDPGPGPGVSRDPA